MRRVHLDTHVAARLAGRRKIAFSQHAKHLIDSSPLVISPLVALELQLLVEIGRSKVPVERSVELLRQLGVTILEERLAEAVFAARSLLWTRDPFDRLIVGHAMADEQSALLTFDDEIRRHYKKAIS